MADRLSLAPYPTPEARDAELSALAARVSAELHAFGTSVEGRTLWVARVPRDRGAHEPDGQASARVLVTANIHGPELVSSRVALGVLARVNDLPSLRRLRARADIWIAPCLNPDGYARTFAAAGSGTLAELRTNARGVDLNRNFPLPAGAVRHALPGAGSSKPGRATYVGTHPLSEPESAALAALHDEHRFCAAVNGHSFFGAVIPARVRDKRAFARYRALAKIFAACQPRVPYRRLANRVFDTFTGELEDFQHHAHGMWAVCLETFSWRASFRQHPPGFAPSLAWRFNPRDPEPWVDNDVPAIAAFLNAALDQPSPKPTTAAGR